MLAPSPHRTAESFLLTPTPITDPVMTWGALTGRPITVAAWMTVGPIRGADIAAAGRQHDNPQRSLELRDVAGSDQGEGHRRHRLLGVVGAVRVGEKRRREDLQTAQRPVHRCRSPREAIDHEQ